MSKLTSFFIVYKINEVKKVFQKSHIDVSSEHFPCHSSSRFAVNVRLMNRRLGEKPIMSIQRSQQVEFMKTT